MRKGWAGLLPVLLIAPTAWAFDEPPDKPGQKDEPPKAEAAGSPSEQFRALVKAYQAQMQAFSQAFAAAETQQAKQDLFRTKYPSPQKYADRFLAIAEKYPDDPAAVDALAWILTRAPTSPQSRKAVEVLSSKHADSPKIAPAVQLMAQYGMDGAEPLFRAAREKNPSQDVKTWSTFGLAKLLKQKSEKGDEAAAKEAEAQFQQVIDHGGDVRTPRGSLADLAKTELFELRHLGIGKPAPEIEGEDVDGKAFKLSDYKGKVVVLDFWGNW